MASTQQIESVDRSQLPASGRRRRTREEMLAIMREAREEVRAANPHNRDLLAELIAERRASANHE
jgi:hypothetical protein